MTIRVFIGMETSGALRKRFAAFGFDVISCDALPRTDDDLTARHIVGDVFKTYYRLHRSGWKADLAIFHPSCTFLTLSAAWAFKDPDYRRYPGVGYHQRVKFGTLVGIDRRLARREAIADVRRIWSLPIKRILIENPRGFLSSMWRKPSQTIQPYQFSDDASKETCFWSRGLPPLRPTGMQPGRIVEWRRDSGKMVERWSNQTDSGQNNLSANDERWQKRSETYPGIACAISSQYAAFISKRFALL